MSLIFEKRITPPLFGGRVPYGENPYGGGVFMKKQEEREFFFF